METVKDILEKLQTVRQKTDSDEFEQQEQQKINESLAIKRVKSFLRKALQGFIVEDFEGLLGSGLKVKLKPFSRTIFIVLKFVDIKIKNKFERTFVASIGTELNKPDLEIRRDLTEFPRLFAQFLIEKELDNG